MNSHVYEPLDETTEIGEEQGAKRNFTTKPFKEAEILQACRLTHA